MKNQEEIKPCPFCGNQPEKLTGMGEYWIKCPKCNSSCDMKSSPDECIKAWNTRSQPASGLKPIDDSVIVELQKAIHCREGVLALEIDQAETKRKFRNVLAKYGSQRVPTVTIDEIEDIIKKPYRIPGFYGEEGYGTIDENAWDKGIKGTRALAQAIHNLISGGTEK